MKDTKKECSISQPRKSTPRALRRSEHNYITTAIIVMAAGAYLLAAVYVFSIHDGYEEYESMSITLKALNARVSELEIESYKQAEKVSVKQASTKADKLLKQKNSTQASQKAPETPKPAAFNSKNSNKSNTYKITFYCPCEQCCGKWAGGNTASGTKPTANRTVAAPASFAFGTQIRIEDLGHFVVEDRGGAIKGNRLDVFVDSHAEALRLGVMRKEVSIVHD